MNELSTVYALVDPTNNQPKYIGVTAIELNSRLSHHIYKAFERIGDTWIFKSNYEKDIWIRGLVGEGVRPIIQPVLTIPSKNKFYWECFIFEAYRESYYLLNCKKPIKSTYQHLIRLGRKPPLSKE